MLVFSNSMADSVFLRTYTTLSHARAATVQAHVPDLELAVAHRSYFSYSTPACTSMRLVQRPHIRCWRREALQHYFFHFNLRPAPPRPSLLLARLRSPWPALPWRRHVFFLAGFVVVADPLASTFAAVFASSRNFSTCNKSVSVSCFARSFSRRLFLSSLRSSLASCFFLTWASCCSFFNSMILALRLPGSEMIGAGTAGGPLALAEDASAPPVARG